MNLPETACVSVRGPKALLDLEGAHWGDDIIFDSTTGGLDADSGLKESTELLRILIKEVLVEKCGYAPREIVIFGFGQGGMVALSTARKSRSRNTKRQCYCTDYVYTVAIQSSATNDDSSSSELGGVISIGAPVPSEAPAALVSKCKTPVLVCAGSDRSAVTSTAEDKLFWAIDTRYWQRAAVKPGMTGLAQVRGFRGATSFEADLTNRLQADLEYLVDWSIWKDLKIIFKTAKVLVHPNAY